jgi:nucleotide-binding universal stress UspA family protein
MSYAALLVHVDLDGPFNGRSSIAAELADRFHALLVGLAGWAPMSVFPAEQGLDNPAIGDFHLTDMKTVLDLKGKEFCAAFERPDRQVEWRSMLDFPTEAIVSEARAADLVIIGNIRENRDPFRALVPANVILKAGRPVLVVPKGLASFSARKIAIAWKDIREARRAVYDALPFLQGAQTVVIIEILEPGKDSGAAHRLEDVASYLNRHRVNTITQQVRPPDVAASDSLLRFIEEENIDLLIAGAYGHSRLGEWAFGGVTRGLLAESRICCLFSH